MQSSKDMGRMVIMPRHDKKLKITSSSTGVKVLRDEVLYPLIGEPGGIDYGARQFIFASRSGSHKQKSKDLIALLKDQCARVFVSRYNSSNADNLDGLLKDYANEMPFIRVIIHRALRSKVTRLYKLQFDSTTSTNHD